MKLRVSVCSPRSPFSKNYGKFMQRITIAGQRVSRATAPYPPLGRRGFEGRREPLVQGIPNRRHPYGPRPPLDASRPAIPAGGAAGVGASSKSRMRLARIRTQNRLESRHSGQSPRDGQQTCCPAGERLCKASLFSLKFFFGSKPGQQLFPGS
jgi:hypothetical protein